jgi:hypothetical protein
LPFYVHLGADAAGQESRLEPDNARLAMTDKRLYMREDGD